MKVCSPDASQFTNANILKSLIHISLFPHRIKNNIYKLYTDLNAKHFSTIIKLQASIFLI